MQRTSESIGTLAAALAKAQIELVNPDKSMLAAIEASGRAEVNQIVSKRCRDHTTTRISA